MFGCFNKSTNQDRGTITRQQYEEVDCYENLILTQENNQDYPEKLKYKNSTKTRINIFLAKEFAKCDHFICTCCEDFLAMVVPLSIFCSIVALIIFMV